jgi:hypothetical protein
LGRKRVLGEKEEQERELERERELVLNAHQF